jgi:heme-degrading monooxygenase HmoA
MMTIVTHVRVKDGSEPAWDAAMKERLDVAKERPGWVAAQLVMPLDGLSKRIIIGTWQTRADWEAWHADPAFAETRKRLEGLESEPPHHWWHEVILDYTSRAAP